MDADRWERKRERWERRWERRHARWNSPGRHLFSGVVFVAIGAIFLLGNMGLLDPGRIMRFWPVILIALGAYRIVEYGDDYGESSGIFWIVVGGFFLLGTLGVLRVALHSMWPIVLIGIGALMLWRSALGKNQRWRGNAGAASPLNPGGAASSASSADAKAEPFFDSATSSNSHFTVTAILGGFERRINSQDFRGGDVTAILGGCKIDLRGASITAPHEPVIKVMAVFGGIEIRVPDDWTVVSEVELILGGLNDKKLDPPRNESKRLIIRGAVLMGGIELRN